jgi:hypothetical protein
MRWSEKFPENRWGGGCRVHTEADAGVLFTNILTLVVGEEHVGRKTTLGRVGVYVCEREGES